ncbi:abortive infection family protein [Acinetobacter sp. SH20PTE14]|uniref:abortive infection family protein n=1 Tax=Acinetobacter sp. SH20PTE14 TaxID=2905879 RepID=UPI001F358C42|nr:abortive infection family protein [Acinetobacter sp. SH20PTE14]UIJ76673.1 abortive infection family protein [Acinetobacter sp. SH20PTE14]
MILKKYIPPRGGFSIQFNKLLILFKYMNQIEKLELLQQILIARATHKHQEGDNQEYQLLRKEFYNSDFKEYLPAMVKTSRNFDQFWQFIKVKFQHYDERRNFIYTEFQSTFERCETSNIVPLDKVIEQAILKIDSNYIHETWNKALERRQVDPQGAITIARTLLESTCKYILDNEKIDYGTTPDLNHLYRMTAKLLNIAPSDHTMPIFKQILGACTSVVEGLGALRNKIGDAHGQGKVNFKPAPRHAELAVNLAGTMAVFLFSTWEIKISEL